jgi:hypothetical protein
MQGPGAPVVELGTDVVGGGEASSRGAVAASC